jgi:hypothetical protein
MAKVGDKLKIYSEDLDDLTAFTPSVMNLLAEFYAQPLIHTLTSLCSHPHPHYQPTLIYVLLLLFHNSKEELKVYFRYPRRFGRPHSFHA